MLRNGSKHGALAVVLVASLAAAGSAAGDWLVTTDGASIETAGPWEVKGRLIVFTRSDGQLSSMRASLVDLEASKQLTEQKAAQAAAPPPAPAPPPSKPPVLVLTDDDVAPYEEEAAAPTDTAAGDEQQRQLAPEGLVVLGWDSLEQDNGSEIVGNLRNDGDLVQTRVEVTVRVLTSDGQPLTVQRAVLANATLPPGRSTEFRLLVPEIYTIERVEFDITAVPFQEAAPAAGQGEEETLPVA